MRQVSAIERQAIVNFQNLETLIVDGMDVDEAQSSRLALHDPEQFIIGIDDDDRIGVRGNVRF